MTSLTNQLEQYGLSLSALSDGAEAVILFGSRAAGLARDDSDWDLLVVGRGRSRLRRGLDLVYIDPESFRGASWQTNELASHIGRWGRTLCGSPTWLASLTDARTSEEAVSRKREQLQAQLSACERYWPSLGPWAQTTRQQRIRRDLQRYARLLEPTAIPPSALLDDEWTRMPAAEQSRSLNRWLRSADLDALGGPWLEPTIASPAVGSGAPSRRS
jgi:hypothetical protein